MFSIDSPLCIPSARMPRARDIFQQYYTRIKDRLEHSTESIQNVNLKLYLPHLISMDTWKKVDSIPTLPQKAALLVQELEEVFAKCPNYQKFKKLCDGLKECDCLQEISTQMLETYSELFHSK